MVNALQCLEETIGLYGLCDTAETVLYVNDLTGVTFASFAEVATQEDVKGKNAFERIRRVAARQVSLDFVSHLRSRKGVNLVSVVSEREEGGFHRDDYYESEAGFIGKEFYSLSGGQPVRQRVDWIEVKSKTEQTVTVFIEVDGVDCHKENYTLRVGINRIAIEKTGDLIRVYLPTDNLELAKQYDRFGNCCDCGRFSSCRCNSGGCGYEKTITGLDGETWADASKDPFRYHTSCVCDTSRIVCRYKEELSEAVWYKVGVLLMEEMIYSPGKSFLIRNSKENAERWIAATMGNEDPETGFKQESKYWKSIARATNSIVESLKDTPCVSCGGLTVTQSIP